MCKFFINSGIHNTSKAEGHKCGRFRTQGFIDKSVDRIRLVARKIVTPSLFIQLLSNFGSD
jgi:hypothetical protein